jgi:hypothetical protein
LATHVILFFSLGDVLEIVTVLEGHRDIASAFNEREA